MTVDIETLAFEKNHGLLPAIVQDAMTGAILMLGYMNQAALKQTLETKQVTFFSRSKNRLWVKGETSGHTLLLVDIHADCDHDTLLITANPNGPTCHSGQTSCFGDEALTEWSFIQDLQDVIKTREHASPEKSYTAKLLQAGVSRIAQKVGEEGVEVALAAVEKDNEKLCEEIADLLFHVLVLLKAKQLDLSQVLKILKKRAT